ncbi:hypothetical protein OKW24_005686 [Peribacillus simplex]|uniref:hypothetical protein n=1 Tax=Peribacillus simplex TaxID=1478 RepID=UPI0024E25BEC|nr:hypothetical protein [Peribacillus simplex]MDF9763790.1 hypothetical protein [Peribacillus simplex]
MNPFKSPIEWLKELIAELVKDFANMAFDWLEIFMLKPTDFTKYPKIDILYDFVFALASSLCIVFVAWAIIGIMFQPTGWSTKQRACRSSFQSCSCFHPFRFCSLAVGKSPTEIKQLDREIFSG